MTHINYRKALNGALSISGATIGAVARGDTSRGSDVMSPGMMGGNGYGWMGGYGGIWLPILLVIVIVVLVAWIITQKKK